MNNSMIFDLYKIYKTYFRDPYTVNHSFDLIESPQYGYMPGKKTDTTTVKGESLYSAAPDIYGRAIFLPVQFWKDNKLFLTINCCTITINSKKTIVRTAVPERQGTIKEQFSVGDYTFKIKGVLIGDNRGFPDEKILKLREIFETTQDVELYNALTGLFMDKSMRVAVTDLDFSDEHGKGVQHRPFNLTCETDFVEGLIVKL